jgi:hypothetical protein
MCLARLRGGKAQYVTWIHMVQEGPEVREYLSTTSGARGVKTTAKHHKTPIVNLCKGM